MLSSGFIRRHSRTVAALAFLFAYSVGISFATPPTSPYQPGATLQPSCLPGSTNCTTQILPSQTGNTGKLLTTDGTITTWTNTPNIGAATGTSLNLSSGAITSGLINGQTISSSANFTGSANFAGNVGVGTTSPINKLDVFGNSGIWRFSNDPGSMGVNFYKSRGASGVNTIIVNGDQLGQMSFYGANGTTYDQSAIILASVDGTPGALNDMPSRLTFYTTTDGTASPTERMRIDNTGNIGIGTTNPSSKLEVSGDIRIATGSGGQIVFADGSTMSSAGLGSAAALSNITDAIVTADSDANTSGAILLKTGSTTRFSISNTGTIAIPSFTTGLIHADVSGNLSSSLIVNGDITDGTIASTKLSSMTSANLASILSDESGTGVVAYTNSPTFTTPNLGTPSTLVVTNASGTASININGTVGATTPNSGAFTTGVFSGLINSTVSNNQRYLNSSSATTGYVYQTVVNTGGYAILGIEGSTTGQLMTGNLAYSTILTSQNATALHLGTDQIARLTILPTSGNVGIGTVSPTYKFQVDIATTAAVNGSGPANSYPIAKFNNASSDAGNRGLEIGAPTGSVANSPVYLKVSGTSSRFSIVDNSNVENFTISGGNVGIGTTSPATALSVLGTDTSLNRTDSFNVLTLTAESGQLPYNGFGPAVLFASRAYTAGIVNSARISSIINNNSVDNFGGSLGFDVTPTAGGSLTRAMTISYNGNVGIGTASPGAKLDVAGGGSFQVGTNNTNALSISGATNIKSHIGTGFGGTFLQNNNYYNGSAYVFDDNTQPSSNVTLSAGGIAFQTGAANTNPTTRLTMDVNGTLGIATTPNTWGNSFHALQIGQTGNVHQSDTGYETRLANNIYWDGVNWKYNVTSAAALINLRNDGGFALYTAPSGTAGTNATITERMLVSQTGATTINALGVGLNVNSTNSNSNKIALQDNGTVRGYLGASSSAYLTIADNAGNTKMYVNTNGTLVLNAWAGNGSSNKIDFNNNNGQTWSLLHVDSFNKFAFQYNGGTIADINSSTGAYTAISDVNKKKNFETYTGGLAEILALKPTLYNMKTQDDGTPKELGFIAQEVQNVIPQAYTQNGDFIGLNYSAFTPVLVNAIKDINLNITDLNNFDRPNTWRDSLIAWFSNASNHITRIFTGEICITEAGQEPECINRAELYSLKQLIAAPSAPSTPPSSPSGGSEQATCTDGIQNQDETGVDTGGVCAPVDVPPPSDVPPPEESPASSTGSE